MSQPSVDIIIPVWPAANSVWERERLRSTSLIPDTLVTEVRGYPNKSLCMISVAANAIESDFLPDKEPSFENIYTQINYAFTRTENKYVLIFGNDDVMYEGMIAQLVRKAEATDAACVYCDYEIMDVEGNHLEYVNLMDHYDFDANCKHPHYPDVCLWRRDVLEEIGGWDVSRGRYACWFNWLRIGKKHGDKIHHIPYYGFRYRMHDLGMHTKENALARKEFGVFVMEWLKSGTQRSHQPA